MCQRFRNSREIKGVRLQFTGTGKCTREEISDDAMIGYTSLAKRIKNGELILIYKKPDSSLLESAFFCHFLWEFKNISYLCNQPRT